MTTPATPTPLRFYLATAIKRICLDSGFVDPDGQMFLAKWQELYVLAKDATNFFIVSEAQASEFVRTERDEKNKLKRADNAPVILPVGPAFEWTVECGSTCPDGCDETIVDRQVKTTKEEALALATQWDGTRVHGVRDFIRVRGPAFYQIKRPTPRPAPVVVPPPPVRNTTPIRSTLDNGFPCNYIGYYNTPASNYDNLFIRLEDFEPPTRTIRRNVASARVSEEILRSVRAFQQATVTPAPASVPETPPSNPTRTGSSN